MQRWALALVITVNGSGEVVGSAAGPLTLVNRGELKEPYFVGKLSGEPIPYSREGGYGDVTAITSVTSDGVVVAVCEPQNLQR